MPGPDGAEVPIIGGGGGVTLVYPALTAAGPGPALSALLNDVLSRLNESAGTDAGGLDTPAGWLTAMGGGVPFESTVATITRYLNEALDDLARTARPLPVFGTYACPAGAVSLPLSAFSVTGGRALWLARALAYGGLPLRWVSRGTLEMRYPSWQMDAPGSPLYWFQDGDGQVGLYPAPAAPGTLSVTGWGLPVKLQNLADSPGWLTEDVTKLAVFYSAAMLAKKNLDDGPLGQRAPVWEEEYREGQRALRTRLPASDRALLFAVGD